MRLALFIPCFVDQFYPQVGAAMVAVLRRLGLAPEFPADQTCCGQPAFNTGYWDEARTLAQRYCEIFDGYDAIVSPSGSCTAMVRNFYPELLGATPPASANTFEFTEFLVKKLGVTDVGAKFAAQGGTAPVAPPGAGAGTGRDGRGDLLRFWRHVFDQVSDDFVRDGRSEGRTHQADRRRLRRERRSELPDAD
jgi:hypothetical protein